MIGLMLSHVRDEKGSPLIFKSNDAHIQYLYQSRNSHFFTIVMQINARGKHEDHDFYKLTTEGMSIVKKCTSNGKEPNLSHEHRSCSLKGLYTSIADESEILSELHLLEIQHCNQFQTIYYNLRSKRKNINTNENQGTNVAFKRKSDSLKCDENIKVSRLDIIAEKAKQTAENSVQKEQNNQLQCKVCKKTFKKSLLSHLSKDKDCRSCFSDDEFEALKLRSAQKYKASQKIYNKTYMKSYYEKNQLQIMYTSICAKIRFGLGLTNFLPWEFEIGTSSDISCIYKRSSRPFLPLLMKSL